MEHRSRRRAAFAAAVAVAVLTVGGTGGAWAASEGSPASRPTPPAWTPAVSGTVTGTGTGSFTVKESDGTVVTVDTTTSTTYAETGAVTPPAGVHTGEQVLVTTVKGTSRSATTVTASRVLVVLTHVVGTVEVVGSGSFTVLLEGGLTVTVDTMSTTVVRKAGVVQSGVTAGETVTAYGAADPTDPSVLDAEFVVVSTTTTATPPHHAPSAPWRLLSGVVSGATSGGCTLTEADGTMISVTTNSSTTYGETGSPTAPTGVADGDRVRVQPVPGTSPTASTVTAARIVVVLTQVTGTVASVTDGSLVVTLFGGLQVTVVTGDSTVYASDGKTVTGVTVGQKVTAYGAPDPSDPSELDAASVDVDTGRGPGGPGASGGRHGWGGGSAPWTGTGTSGGHAPWSGTSGGTGTPPSHEMVAGTVTSVTGDDIVLKEFSGSTVTVVVSSSTRYVSPSGTATLGSIGQGIDIGAFGTPAGAGQVAAAVVLVGGTPGSGTPSGWTPGARPSGAGAPTTTSTTSPGHPTWPAGSSGTPDGTGGRPPVTPTTTPTSVPPTTDPTGSHSGPGSWSPAGDSGGSDGPGRGGARSWS